MYNKENEHCLCTICPCAHVIQSPAGPPTISLGGLFTLTLHLDESACIIALYTQLHFSRDLLLSATPGPVPFPNLDSEAKVWE